MTNNKKSRRTTDQALKEIKLFVPDHLYSAFHRCVWILVNQTERSQIEIMEEVIHDFLIKHEC